MKIGIPAMGDSGLDEQVSSHFGRAPTFVVVDSETKECETLVNVKRTGRNEQPPEQLSEKGVELVLCSGMGPRAIKMFEQFGIEVFLGAEGTIQDTLEKWENGELKEASDKNACQEHRH